MKKIFLYLVTLAVSLVLTDRIFFYFFTRHIFTKTLSGDTGGSVTYLLQNKKNTDFIILGSSRAKYHINPTLLYNLYNGNGYNAGVAGTGGIIYNYMLLNLLISKNIKPKAVILQVDPYYYFTSGVENYTNELLPLYPYIGESRPLSSFIYKNTSYAEKFKLFFHSYRYNGKFFGVLYNYTKRSSFKGNNGFEALTGKIDTTSFSPAMALEKAQYYSNTKISALNNFITTCKTESIKLLVVIMPTYKNSSFFKQANDTITGILRKDSNVKIYDFYNFEKTSLLQSPDLWKDGGHLNSKGAAIFSKQLNDTMFFLKSIN
jgi:hypothetical protein